MAVAERFEYRVSRPTVAQTQDPTGRDVATEAVTEGWVNNGLSKSVTVTGLDPTSWYLIEVRGVNDEGNGPISSDWARTNANRPSKPTNFRTTISGQSVRLLAAVVNNGSVITKWQYRVATSAAGLASATWTDFATSAGNTLDETLTQGYSLTRHYEVRAVNAIGNGDPSDSLSATTGARPLPAAAAGLVSIAAVSSVLERATQTLRATASGGTKDRVTYAWTILRGGGTITGSGASVTYTAPSVSANATGEVQCVATFHGDGTLARDGTSATATDTEVFTITNTAPPLPDASAANGIIAGGSSRGVFVGAGILFHYSLVGAGGVYDRVTAVWSGSIVGSGTFRITPDGTACVYEALSSPTDTTGGIAVSLTYHGDGIRAKAGTSATGSARRTFPIRVPTPR